MTPRDQALAAFLDGTPFADWTRAPLAGDASNRRYLRLSRGADRAVAMDAPPERGEDVRPFVRIARHLRGLGLRAPDIMAMDADRGFLVLEDLGDDLFARLLARDPGAERRLYSMATDVLLELHRHPPLPGLPAFAPPFDAEFIALAHAWYRPGATGQMPEEAGRFCDALNRALLAHADGRSVTILRDFHAENLLLCGDRVGLLDFQDAMAGHPAYDLASLLTDARRDVSAATREAMVDRYLAASGRNGDDFRAALAVLGAQRNLRILGVFARLSLAHGKAGYVDLIPRVWGHLMRDLDHPALSDLAAIVRADLPAPTPDHLTDLRARCATLRRP